MGTDYIAGYQATIGYAGTPVQVDAPEGHSVKLTHLVSVNLSLQTIYLVDGRIGEKLLPLSGTIDFGFFGRNSSFKVGTITPDEPLRLYFAPSESNRSVAVAPVVNFVIKGTIEHWKAPVATPEEQKRLGIVDIHDFIKWFEKQPVTDSLKQAWNNLSPMLTIYQGGGEVTPPEPSEKLTPSTAKLMSVMQQHLVALQQQQMKKFYTP